MDDDSVEVIVEPEPEPENMELCTKVQESALYDLIMEYRAENGLPSIPLSFSLTTVAQMHASDLQKNANSFASDCNNHSWSGDGAWNECCYVGDHSNAECMWEKPRELTDYPDNGFEIVSWGFQDTEGALDLWIESEPHNDVLLNRSFWDDDWNAIGVGIDGNFATAWFGKTADSDGTIEQCP